MAPTLRRIALLLRVMIGVNFFRFALSFFPWFEGTADQPGMADRLFGDVRIDGWRLDICWLVGSSFFVFVGLLLLIPKGWKEPAVRVTAYLFAAWMVAFFVYFIRALLQGVLYFG